jgi:hypothetical protein
MGGDAEVIAGQPIQRIRTTTRRECTARERFGD